MLCGPDGLLNRQAIGWSRHPLHTCNLPDSLQRKKKWNYWAVTSNDLLFSATIADIERLQLAGAYIFDRQTQRHIEKTVLQSPNTITIPETIAGDMVIEHPDMRVALTDDGSGTRIRVAAADFGGMASGRHRRRAAGRPRDAECGHPLDRCAVPVHFQAEHPPGVRLRAAR